MNNAIFKGEIINFYGKCLLYILLFTGILLKFTPLTPAMPGDGLDPSWVMGMNLAVSSGLSIGKDLIFTYGPYAAISTKAFDPNIYFIIMYSALFISIFYFISIVNLGFNNKNIISIIMLWFFLSQSEFLDPILYLYPIIIAFILIKNNENLHVDGKKLVYLIPFGLIILIKGSSILIVLPSLLIISSVFLFFGRFKQAILSLIIPILSSLFFWKPQCHPYRARPFLYKQRRGLHL